MKKTHSKQSIRNINVGFGCVTSRGKVPVQNWTTKERGVASRQLHIDNQCPIERLSCVLSWELSGRGLEYNYSLASGTNIHHAVRLHGAVLT